MCNSVGAKASTDVAAYRSCTSDKQAAD